MNLIKLDKNRYIDFDKIVYILLRNEKEYGADVIYPQISMLQKEQSDLICENFSNKLVIFENLLDRVNYFSGIMWRDKVAVNVDQIFAFNIAPSGIPGDNTKKITYIEMNRELRFVADFEIYGVRLLSGFI